MMIEALLFNPGDHVIVNYVCCTGRIIYDATIVARNDLNKNYWTVRRMNGPHKGHTHIIHQNYIRRIK